jgi:hypothetical protein
MQQQFDRTQVGWRFWLWWVVATTAGCFVFGAVTGAEVESIVIVGVLIGAVVGWVVWLLFLGEDEDAPGASFGIMVGVGAGFGAFAGAVGRGVGWAVTETVTWVLAAEGAGWLSWAEASTIASTAGLVVGWAVFGALSGCITGGVAVWLLRRPIPDAN